MRHIGIKPFTFKRYTSILGDFIAVTSPMGMNMGDIDWKHGGAYVEQYQMLLHSKGVAVANMYMLGFMQGHAHTLTFSHRYPRVKYDDSGNKIIITVTHLDGRIETSSIEKQDSSIIIPGKIMPDV
jgi:hypothetical protein